MQENTGKGPSFIKKNLLALRELGLEYTSLYLLYRVGLALGVWKGLTPTPGNITLPEHYSPHGFALPQQPAETLSPAARQQAIQLADEVVDGQFRMYGADPAPIRLDPGKPLAHWTKHHSDWHNGADIKDTWEPARFGWAFTLGRAYHLTRDERYPAAFLRHFYDFQTANPAHLGPNWASAQEVAFRIIAFTFSLSCYEGSASISPSDRRSILESVVIHARRIPPTLLYARAQNNNHLLLEAAGLITAARLLPAHADAARWMRMGIKWFNRALHRQIDDDGEYVQHSTNYHRLMLQAALWIHALETPQEPLLSRQSLDRLKKAVEWLANRFDTLSGGVSNLGHNDGALLLPLSGSEFGDYRPTLQAASLAFCGAPALPSGAWDELPHWLGLTCKAPLHPIPPGRERIGDQRTWASLRSVHYTTRPAHADLLHVDLWHSGTPILLDAGSYRYTAPEPWQNALSGAAVHNTITINGTEPMLRAGKFLWLERAQARVITKTPEEITAQHNGYAKIGLLHQRSLSRPTSDLFLVRDQLIPTGQPCSAEITYSLHWLFPDVPWHLDIHEGSTELALQFTAGTVKASFQDLPPGFTVCLVRAGEPLNGCTHAYPLYGWYSPTYSIKVPALSVIITGRANPPLSLMTYFQLPTS